MKTLIDIQISVPFKDYKDKTLNNRALRQIKKYIKEVISSEVNFVPLHIEKDIEGRVFEDCSKKTSVKITKAKLKK